MAEDSGDCFTLDSNTHPADFLEWLVKISNVDVGHFCQSRKDDGTLVVNIKCQRGSSPPFLCNDLSVVVNTLHYQGRASYTLSLEMQGGSYREHFETDLFPYKDFHDIAFYDVIGIGEHFADYLQVREGSYGVGDVFATFTNRERAFKNTYSIPIRMEPEAPTAV